MMSRRPVSSPGRVEKYPPPLVRFLRSSSSGRGSRSRSRSRGRSRSSPLFVRRSKSSSAAAAAAAATQEPSSPKVTCMGQVRVRRSKPQNQPGSRGNPTRRCKWIRNALFRRPFAGKLRSWSFSGTWPKWVSFSFPNFRRKPKRKKNSPGNEPGSGIDPDSVQENGRESQEGENEWGNHRNPRILVSPAPTPPRNALLLTRSRSAPYSSSSLAFRFWESDNRRETEEPNSREKEDEEGEGNFRPEGESISRNSDTGTTGKIEGFGESESSIEEREAKCEKKEEDEETSEVGIAGTAVLGRSKSGPARIGEKMVRGGVLDEEEEG